MDRLRTNVVVDTLALAAVVFLVATGSLIKFVLPPGSGHFQSLWGMDRHAWGKLHYWIACAFTAAVLLHLLLHWKWIVCTVTGRSPERAKRRIVGAILLLAIVVGLGAAPFFGCIEQVGEPPHRQQFMETPSASVTDVDGRMTLQEIEARTGVSASVILKEMGLPADVPTDERLGQLRKQYNFRVHDIQPILQKHMAEQEALPNARP